MTYIVIIQTPLCNSQAIFTFALKRPKFEDVHFDIFIFHISVFYSGGFRNAAKEVTVGKGINSIICIFSKRKNTLKNE